MVYLSPMTKQRRFKVRMRLSILLIIAVSILVVAVFEVRLRPLIVTAAKSRARLYATEVINDSVDEALAAAVAENRSKLVSVIYGDAGVQSIETDVYAVSRLRTTSVKNVVLQVSDIDKMTFSVPIGNLLGGILLTGRGFPVSIKLVPIGDVDAELFSEFVEAGINQTMHRIYIRVGVSMNMLVAAETVKLELSNDILVSETIIVGDVPDAYTSINRFEIDEDEENDINDYAATLP